MSSIIVGCVIMSYLTARDNRMKLAWAYTLTGLAAATAWLLISI